MTIVFNMDTIRLLNLFESITNVPVKDCYVNDENIYFIVEEGKTYLETFARHPSTNLVQVGK